MLTRIIDWSVGNRLLVLLATAAAIAGGVWAVMRTPLEALPDLQRRAGHRAGRVQRAGTADRRGSGHVSDRGARCSRCPARGRCAGYSFFGISFVYVIFEDGTDLYWARSPRARVPERHQRQAAGDRDADARARCHRTRLGLPVRAGGHHRAAGLSPSSARCRTGISATRSRRCPASSEVASHRRIREAVPGGSRSRAAPGVRHPHHARDDAPSRAPTPMSARW